MENVIQQILFTPITGSSWEILLGIVVWYAVGFFVGKVSERTDKPNPFWGNND